ncbi:hypothetical protein F7725_005172 [Dissostichus mawsoni]|uniref:Reverse transcriptase domain-containing protein n=1 Tax=Dissostichus mawsoni TaxID=36200 RepID=A0A7J5YTN6_DISMA|nr:hypothetical protein F7725_005172 [Dissostichus mawsoni]
MYCQCTQSYVWASGRERLGSHGTGAPPPVSPLVLRHSRALVAVAAVVDEDTLTPVMVPLRFGRVAAVVTKPFGGGWAPRLFHGGTLREKGATGVRGLIGRCAVTVSPPPSPPLHLLTYHEGGAVVVVQLQQSRQGGLAVGDGTRPAVGLCGVCGLRRLGTVHGFGQTSPLLLFLFLLLLQPLQRHHLQLHRQTYILLKQLSPLTYLCLLHLKPHTGLPPVTLHPDVLFLFLLPHPSMSRRGYSPAELRSAGQGPASPGQRSEDVGGGARVPQGRSCLREKGLTRAGVPRRGELRVAGGNTSDWLLAKPCRRWLRLRLPGLAFKQALNSGRVYKQRLNVCDPSPTPAGDVRVDFEQYARLLSDCEWTTFQRDERAYRGTLDKNCSRILKKFPLSADFPVDLTPDSLTPWIEMQLRFIRERIQPALRAAGTETQRQQRKVSRNKLAYLWQHRKSKAIDIILNNSCFPETPPTVSDTANVYNHYKAKCQTVPRATPLATPPWYNFIDRIEPGYFPDTQDFTTEEVDAVLASLPNNKASGSDGVIYETLRATRPTSTQTLTHIFNACLINEKVICGQQLTEPIALKVGIKTGCPWSAVNFILALNQWMKWIYQCAPLHVKSPNPVQGYADDVQVSSRQEDVIINMLARTDEFLQWSGLEVKQAKCAVLHERRSGGNRWYKAKNDKPPSFLVMGQPIKVYSRNETYPYLGHRFNIAGEWGEQVEELTTEFLHRLHLIDLSPLPVLMKFQAVREVALAKIQHLFANVHIPLKALREMTNKTVQLVRKWVGLNTHSNGDHLSPMWRGGAGSPQC